MMKQLVIYSILIFITFLMFIHNSSFDKVWGHWLHIIDELLMAYVFALIIIEMGKSYYTKKSIELPFHVLLVFVSSIALFQVSYDIKMGFFKIVSYIYLFFLPLIGYLLSITRIEKKSPLQLKTDKLSISRMIEIICTQMMFSSLLMSKYPYEVDINGVSILILTTILVIILIYLVATTNSKVLSKIAIILRFLIVSIVLYALLYRGSLLDDVFVNLRRENSFIQYHFLLSNSFTNFYILWLLLLIPYILSSFMGNIYTLKSVTLNYRRIITITIFLYIIINILIVIVYSYTPLIVFE